MISASNESQGFQFTKLSNYKKELVNAEGKGTSDEGLS